jgi:HEAT repeat protein
MGSKKVYLMFVATVTLSILALSPGPATARKIKDITLEALESSDPQRIAKAIADLQRSGTPKAVGALFDRIVSGLPPDLVESAIDAMVSIGRGPAAKKLSKLSNHRIPSVRIKVVAGLAHMRAPGAMRLATDMLDDVDPAVRGAAARAIGKLGARPAMDRLIETIPLGLSEAEEVVARQARSSDVSRILKHVDQTSLDSFAPVLSKLVQRTKLPKKSRLAIVKHLGEIATPLSRQTLLESVEDLPENDPIRRAAARTLNLTTSSGEEGKPKKDHKEKEVAK